MNSLTVAQKRERQTKWDIRFLKLCRDSISTWSKDPSTKCGSVIVRDVNKFVSLGYNGYAEGVADDDTLNVREEKYQRVIHAEKNAILFAQRDLTGNTIYVFPLAPCGQCAAAICQVGINRVVTVIPNDDSLKERWSKDHAAASDQFQKRGVEIVFYTENDLA
jgi:dCMP deaminase